MGADCLSATLCMFREQAWECVHAERKRKHAPISYKPPGRHTSGAERDKGGTETAKREAVLDKKGSDADALPKQGSGLEGRLSGLDRSVSRTESGHKLSVFERLQRYALCPVFQIILWPGLWIEHLFVAAVLKQTAIVSACIFH